MLDNYDLKSEYQIRDGPGNGGHRLVIEMPRILKFLFNLMVVLHWFLNHDKNPASCQKNIMLDSV